MTSATGSLAVSSPAPDGKQKRDYDFFFNLLLIGDSYVGKSNMLDCYKHGKFNHLPLDTLGGHNNLDG